MNGNGTNFYFAFLNPKALSKQFSWLVTIFDHLFISIFIQTININ